VVDFEHIWAQQAVSPELRAMIGDWVVEIDRRLRETAKARMPSEWAKKQERGMLGGHPRLAASNAQSPAT
jgi:hypothetical protein